jgi:iron(III) transport system substrate-binding protein
VRGRYQVRLGNVIDELASFAEQGLKANVTLMQDAPKSLSIGFGSTQLMKNQPHPNATKVYVNWLMSQKAGATISKTVRGVNSLRLDVPAAYPDLALEANRLNEYIPINTSNCCPLATKPCSSPMSC